MLMHYNRLNAHRTVTQKRSLLYMQGCPQQCARQRGGTPTSRGAFEQRQWNLQESQFQYMRVFGNCRRFQDYMFQTKAVKDLETLEGVFGNCQHSGERFRRDNETFNESQGKGFFSKCVGVKKMTNIRYVCDKTITNKDNCQFWCSRPAIERSETVPLVLI